MVRFIAAALLCLAATEAPAAVSLYERYFGERESVAPCYARQPDTPRPGRRIARFFVRHADEENLRPPGSFEVAFGFTLAGSDELFASEAGCAAVGPVARCEAADDGGQFTLAPEGEGVKLTIGNRLTLEGPETFSPDLSDGRDDLIIMLQPAAPEACELD